MSDTTAHPARDVGSAWVAAYAIGLAYSCGFDQQCVMLLVDATRDQTDLLDVARRRLQHADVVELSVRNQALRLLRQAAATC